MIGDNYVLIDLGTNSFHLMICREESQGFYTLLKTKQTVGLLAENPNYITHAAFERALNTLALFKQTIKNYNVKQQKILATEGLRRAGNAKQFIQKAKRKFDFDIEVINGKREAELIFKGVNDVAELSEETVLVMDIGGGSCEFIIGNAESIFWSLSVAIGSTLMRGKFHKTEPIASHEYRAMIAYMDEQLQPLWQAISKYKPAELIGSSGSFETLVSIQRSWSKLYPVSIGHCEIVNLSGFRVIHLQLLQSNYNERLAIPGIEAYRANIIVPATSLISLVLSKMQTTRSILVSFFAMKEGMLTEMTNELEKDL